MIGTLSEKDTSDYWMTELINDLVVSMDSEEESISSQFVILHRDDIKPADSNYIVFNSETTYDRTFYGNGYHSETIMEYKTYTLQVASKLAHNKNISNYEFDLSANLCSRVFNTLNMYLHQHSFPNHNLMNVLRTSMPNRPKMGRNKQITYDMRYTCIFSKTKEKFLEGEING